MIRIISEVTGIETHFPELIGLLPARGCEYREVSADVLQTDADLVRALGEYDVIVTCDQHTWTRDILSTTTRTKLLIRVGKGVDNVDVEAAKEFGITVANTGSANASAVAEHTMALLLAAVHHLPEADKQLHVGDWDHISQMRELKSATIGLAGFGAIAQGVARMLSGFVPKAILAYDPYPNTEMAKQLNVQLVDFDALLAQSDIICVHVPLMDSTWHMFNKEAFDAMRQGAIFISIARGHVVDENALYDALVSRKLKWAGLDVFETEPLPADDRLLTLDNVFGTPHSAAHSVDAMLESQRQAAEQLLEFADGKAPRHAL
ncbi:phosphoglycerate dehydrogenase [Eubacteriales bacterium OttesenSCG-928-N13]|nr:phosphoglycerate dehydrogenase [Eubacteriales bacterium OttesenSCG-928-N13]